MGNVLRLINNIKMDPSEIGRWIELANDSAKWSNLYKRLSSATRVNLTKTVLIQKGFLFHFCSNVKILSNYQKYKMNLQKNKSEALFLGTLNGI